MKKPTIRSRHDRIAHHIDELDCGTIIYAADIAKKFGLGSARSAGAYIKRYPEKVDHITVGERVAWIRKC